MVGLVICGTEGQDILIRLIRETEARRERHKDTL
jgi:hypothetical protein